MSTVCRWSGPDQRPSAAAALSSTGTARPKTDRARASQAVSSIATTTTSPADVAIELCARCPVAGACLAWALSVGDCHGVWGGTTARERRAMLVAWRTEEQPEELQFADCTTDVFVSAGELVAQPRRPVTTMIPRQVERPTQPFGRDAKARLAREPVRAAC